MSDNTGIEWTDATWNPVTGCTEVSPGCDHCYAESIAHRFDGTRAYPAGFAVTLRPERLELPLRWTRPRRIFVNSMSDLFHTEIPDAYVVEVFAVMAAAGRHSFQVLTKRHARMRSLLNDQYFRAAVRAKMPAAAKPPPGELPWPLPNVWLGVSVESQQWADIRIPPLLQTPAAVRFISAEPLLGPIDLELVDFDGATGLCVLERPRRIDWVIAGGESGPHSRPMHPAWPRQLRDQCVANGVPFLFKQWGEWVAPKQIPDAARFTGRERQTTVAGKTVLRLGKKHAGRELDGRLWDQYPDEVPVA